MDERIRVTVMIPREKYVVLAAQAREKGVSVPTYCRMLLSEWAEVPADNKAA